MNTTPRTIEKQHATLGRPSAAPVMTKEITEMLIYEELARARIRDMEEAVHVQRIRGNARAARRWSRMARWAAKRAHRYQAE